ncbi:MAG: hypothetical protein RIS47_1850 [Bacteroidota bacterium]|jgi:Holliday junction DNA helicase RuvA
MYEYIQGEIAQLAAGYVIVEAGGIGYFVHISLHTYGLLQNQKTAKIFLHQVIREDAHTLFGFGELGERELFRLLISVNGIGSNTAVTMLSALKHTEIRNAIATENLLVLKSMKGIGPKTAQRVIIELKDKVGVASGSESAGLSGVVAEEACMALEMLGFQKKNIEKTVMELLKTTPSLKVEDLIKQALKQL